MRPYSIDGAMAEALNHLNLISCHFRVHGQHHVANEIGKLSIMIVNKFSEGVEHLTPEEYVLAPEDSVTQESASTQLSSHIDNQKPNGSAYLCDTEKENNGYVDGTRKMPEGRHLHTGSWAQVVGSISNGHSHEVQCMSPMSLALGSVSKPSQSSDDGTEGRESGNAGVTLPASVSPDIPDAKAGVIRVYGKITRDFIQYITTRIHEGPLQDIRVETNGRTKVTFQHAAQALAFLNSNQDMERMLGYGRLGEGYRVELAEIIDWNEDHRRMNQPIRERRRLSFARKRLFAEGMSPDKWKQDIRALAGPGNIDFLWVFNSGNATAVFTSTVVARRVLEVFEDWKNGRNVYSGVSVTYSSDPCEKELVLVRETNRPGMARNFIKRTLR
ncbi:similar to An07g07550 [Aspergillus luchuensis]|uniref:Similar to An07g07550 n=1 Tax=Aspergillus kawachii TaxID=1069201 RepID=A0A146F181_ASPKA|nr:similar to An07g07550 [Aspergillus luchuensis]